MYAPSKTIASDFVDNRIANIASPSTATVNSVTSENERSPRQAPTRMSARTPMARMTSGRK